MERDAIHMITYQIACPISPKEIADLRKSVGWNKMTGYYEYSLQNSYFYICCFDNKELISFLDVVSNAATDAYIQDVIVKPSYQGKGIGTHLMEMAIKKLKDDNIYAISVLFEERLLIFYKKFGFNIMMAGQIITHDVD